MEHGYTKIVLMGVIGWWTLVCGLSYGWHLMRWEKWIVWKFRMACNVHKRQSSWLELFLNMTAHGQNFSLLKTYKGLCLSTKTMFKGKLVGRGCQNQSYILKIEIKSIQLNYIHMHLCSSSRKYFNISWFSAWSTLFVVRTVKISRQCFTWPVVNAVVGEKER